MPTAGGCVASRGACVGYARKSGANKEKVMIEIIPVGIAAAVALGGGTVGVAIGRAWGRIREMKNKKSDVKPTPKA